jgi:hypothetical protein
MSPDAIKKGRQFQMGMDIHQTRHQDCPTQLNDTMTGISPDQLLPVADLLDLSITDGNRSTGDRLFVRMRENYICYN